MLKLLHFKAIHALVFESNVDLSAIIENLAILIIAFSDNRTYLRSFCSSYFSASVKKKMTSLAIMYNKLSAVCIVLDDRLREVFKID